MYIMKHIKVSLDHLKSIFLLNLGFIAPTKEIASEYLII